MLINFIEIAFPTFLGEWKMAFCRFQICLFITSANGSPGSRSLVIQTVSTDLQHITIEI